jgi:hypothetical protein
MSGGVTVERADGGKLTDREFLKALPKKYIRVKFELNKAKIKADGLDDADLASLGLVRVNTLGMKLKAKACYEFQREEYKTAEAELCAYANAHREVFEGTDGVSGWGSTDTVEYVMSGGMTVERADGGKLTDREFLKGLPKKYLRVKFELNKAKIKADALDDNALAALGLVRVETLGLKLKAKAA